MPFLPRSKLRVRCSLSGMPGRGVSPKKVERERMLSRVCTSKTREECELLTRIRASKLPGNGAVVCLAVCLQGRHAQEPLGQTFDGGVKGTRAATSPSGAIKLKYRVDMVPGVR